MYVSMKEMLERANKGYYAVMAINCFNLESAKAVIKAAQELRAPIIVNLLQEHLQHHFDSHLLIPPIIKMAQEASIEVAINLDHGSDVHFVKRCIVNGISSVMIDAAALPLEDNIKVTNSIVDFAKIYNVSVEAEVGNIGSAALNNTINEMYTDVGRAISFINKTKIDALAVCYGSAHGGYENGNEPIFNFDIVKKIKQETNIPLVLHGGSGSGTDNIEKSVEVGINKINVGYDFMNAQILSIEKNIKRGTDDYVKIMNDSIIDGKEIVKHYISISGSEGKSI